MCWSRAPAGTALAAVGRPALAAVAVGGLGVPTSAGRAAAAARSCCTPGGERLDPQRCALGEPPLVDGAVLSLQGPGEPEPGTRAADGAAPSCTWSPGPDAGGVHLLHGGQIRIGRSADADVPLDDPDVSRLHCAVTVAADGRVTVADLGSTNGTTLDGAAVGTRPVRCAPGALLRIGESRPAAAPPGRTGRPPCRRPRTARGIVRVHRRRTDAPDTRYRPAGRPRGAPGRAGTRRHAPAAATAPARPGPYARRPVPAGARRGRPGGSAAARAGRSPRAAGAGPRAPAGAHPAPAPAPAGPPSARRPRRAHRGAPATAPTPAPGPRPRRRRGGAPVRRPGRPGTGRVYDRATADGSRRRPASAPASGARPTGVRRSRPARTHAGSRRCARRERPVRARGGAASAAWARRLARRPAAGAGEAVRGRRRAEPDDPAAATRRRRRRPGAADALRPPPRRWPDPAALLLTALGPGPRLWERGPGHPEALDRPARHGRPAARRLGLLPAVPVTVGLREAGSLGLAGPRARLAGLARAVVAQLAALHSPAHPGDRPDQHGPVARPPRSASPSGPGSAGSRMCARRTARTAGCCSPTTANRPRPAPTNSLRRLDDGPLGPAAGPTAGPRRPSAAGRPARATTGSRPYTVVVVDGDPGGAALREAAAGWRRPGRAPGSTCVCLAETPAASPASPVTATYEAACAASPAVPRVRGGRAAQRGRGDGAAAAAVPAGGLGRPGHGTVGAVDAVSAAWAERFARALAPLRGRRRPRRGGRAARGSPRRCPSRRGCWTSWGWPGPPRRR